MIPAVVLHEVINGEGGFDSNQGPKHKRRLPWFNEVGVIVAERLLNDRNPWTSRFRSRSGLQSLVGSNPLAQMHLHRM